MLQRSFDALLVLVILLAPASHSAKSSSLALEEEPAVQEEVQEEAGSPGVGTRSEVDALWDLAESDLMTQRAVRLSYDGPDGNYALFMVLRLERAERYSLEARDRLGRRWFRLVVDGERGLLLDDRERLFCEFDGAVEIATVPLGPLSFDLLPGMLLGYLPVRPVGVYEREPGSWSVQDSRSRTWTVRVDEGRLQTWTLWNDEQPRVWWRRDDRWSYLSAPRESLQLRWRTGTVEKLAQELLGLTPPEGFELGDCSSSATPV